MTYHSCAAEKASLRFAAVVPLFQFLLSITLLLRGSVVKADAKIRFCCSPRALPPFVQTHYCGRRESLHHHYNTKMDWMESAKDDAIIDHELHALDFTGTLFHRGRNGFHEETRRTTSLPHFIQTSKTENSTASATSTLYTTQKKELRNRHRALHSNTHIQPIGREQNTEAEDQLRIPTQTNYNSCRLLHRVVVKEIGKDCCRWHTSLATLIRTTTILAD